MSLNFMQRGERFRYALRSTSRSGVVGAYGSRSRVVRRRAWPTLPLGAGAWSVLGEQQSVVQSNGHRWTSTALSERGYTACRLSGFAAPASQKQGT